MNIVERWKVTGLLEDCKNDIEAQALASVLQRTAEYLLNGFHEKLVYMIMLPLVAKIFYHDKTKYIDFSILEDLIQKHRYKIEEYNDMPHFSSIDAEAEYCEFIFDMYIRR